MVSHVIRFDFQWTKEVLWESGHKLGLWGQIKMGLKPGSGNYQMYDKVLDSESLSFLTCRAKVTIPVIQIFKRDMHRLRVQKKDEDGDHNGLQDDHNRSSQVVSSDVDVNSQMCSPLAHWWPLSPRSVFQEVLKVQRSRGQALELSSLTSTPHYHLQLVNDGEFR